MQVSGTIRTILRGYVSPRKNERSPGVVELVFNCADPLMIRVICPGQEPGEWEFARSLLDDGLTRPTGAGRVRIRPNLFTPIPMVRLRFALPAGGACLVEVPADEVAEFLYWTHRFVPRPGTKCSGSVSPTGELVREAG